jgi:hypothetical protein
MVGVVDRCFYSTLITMETSGLRIEKEKAAETHISVSHPQNLVQIHEEILTGGHSSVCKKLYVSAPGDRQRVKSESL